MRTSLLLFGLAALAFAGDPLDDALIALRTAAPADRDEAVKRVLDLAPAPGEVIRRLRGGVRVSPAAPGWHLLEATDEEGVARPYQLYVPKSLAAREAPGPLLVYLHGGVARPEFLRAEGQVGAGTLWIDSAEREAFAIAFPAGRQDCMWWTEAGVRHIRAVVRDAKRRVPVDDDRVVASGFSDGGSGCYYLAFAAPDPFAALLPMNGHPAVASASGHQLYLRNFRRTPMFAAMTLDDPLYPGADVLDHLVPVVRAGAPLRIVSYESGGHQPLYFDEQRPAFEAFVREARRDPAPAEIEWSCADTKTGRVAWVEILELGPAAGDAEAPEDLNPMVGPGRPRLGISADNAFEGPGVRVGQVVEGSAAAAMGVAPGDIVVGLDGEEVDGLRALVAALGRKGHGDEVKVAVRRGAETVELGGRFPPAAPRPAYLRTKPEARVVVRAEGGEIRITARHVRRLRLRLDERLFGGPVRVFWNERSLESLPEEIPLAETLRRYAAEADGGQVAGKWLTLSVPPG
jgi:poly(3-hydroxybutyrate) depolymerase